MNTTMDHLRTIMLALPTLAALERLQPADMLERMRDVVSRVGVGAVRSVASVDESARAPSKYDEHGNDG